jgi:hypothetical protein
MIGKKIPARGTGGKVARIGDLIAYVTDPGVGRSDPDRPEELSPEKCVYSGAVGFISTDPGGWRAEMAALALAAPQSADPVCHYVISWAEGEHPSCGQVDEMVHIVLEELGLRDHQTIYALHRDTNNDHVHLVVNRVHPETERVIRAGGGWDRRALLQSVSRIEIAQGWQQVATPAAEREAAEADRRGKTSREERRRERAQERPRGSDRARDGAHRHGERSAVEIARERAGELFDPAIGARTWAELHAALAARGLRYERKGSGALLYVGETPVKASDVSRDASFAKLTKHLGPYQPATLEQAEQARAHAPGPEPTERAAESADRSNWNEYQRARRERQAEGRADRAALTARHRQERAALQSAQRERRRAATAGNWRGRGAELNAIRSQLAAQDARERLDLRDRQARQRAARAKKSAKSYEDWLRQQGRGQQADAYARWIAPRLVGEDQPAVPRDIRAFSSHAVGSSVEYRRNADRRLAFIDAGRTIDMTSSREDDAMIGALQLAQAKWGRVQISGSSEFRERAARAAAREGIRVVDADLADIVADEQARMRRGEPPQGRQAAERDRRTRELAQAQRLTQLLIRDMVGSGDYACSDGEWVRACSDDLETVRAECRSWAEAALEAGWTVPLETLSIAGLDGSAAPSEQRTSEDLGR